MGVGLCSVKSFRALGRVLLSLEAFPSCWRKRREQGSHGRGSYGPGLEETQNTWSLFHWPELSSPATATCMEAGNVRKEEKENMGVGGNQSLDVWSHRFWLEMSY